MNDEIGLLTEFQPAEFRNLLITEKLVPRCQHVAMPGNATEINQLQLHIAGGRLEPAPGKIGIRRQAFNQFIHFQRNSRRSPQVNNHAKRKRILQFRLSAIHSGPDFNMVDVVPSQPRLQYGIAFDVAKGKCKNPIVIQHVFLHFSRAQNINPGALLHRFTQGIGQCLLPRIRQVAGGPAFSLHLYRFGP
ncbi:MAG: hypothetical protein WC299_04735 [Kiritimatiellia bacterium]